MNKLLNKIFENKWLLLILLTAAILRFYNLDYQSLWMDEIYTLNVASPKHSFSQIISEVNLRESFPYLYFFIMNTIFTLFGETSIVARIPSVIFGIAAVLMMYKLGKETHSKKVGLIAALLFTFNEYAIFHSQDARAYSLYLLCLLFSFYRFVIFLKNNTQKNMIWFAISAGLLVNVNFFSVLNVITQGFILLYVLFSLDKSERADYFKRLLIIAGIILLFFIPNAYKFYLLSQFKSSWIPAPSNDGLTNILKEFISVSEILVFIYGILFTFFIIKVFNQKRTKSIKEIIDNKLVFNYLLIAAWISFVVVVILLKSYLSSSLYVSRYFISIFPAVILAISIALVSIKNKQIRMSFLALLMFFMAFDLVVVKKYYHTPLKAQFREASLTAINNNPEDHEVYTSQKYWFDYYFTLEKSKLTTEIELETLLNEMSSDSTKIKSFWFVDAFGKTYNPSENSKALIDKYFVINKSFDGFQAWAKHFVVTSELPQSIDLSGLNFEKDYSGDSFMFNLEVFEIVNNKVNLSGWAYFDGISSENSKVSIVLINKKTNIKKTKTIPIQSVVRQDVTSYFKCDFNADNSGFKAEYDISNLDDEDYVIGVYLENKNYNKKGLFISDKKIKKNNSY